MSTTKLCERCKRRLKIEATSCICGWGDVVSAAAGPKCGNCGKPLTGPWTQSPKGRVCDLCWRGYMGTGWPVMALGR